MGDSGADRPALMAALEGTRILDLTRLLPGPAATHWMRQMGAEVIKVEQPGAGDPMRAMEPRGLFHLINQGKKSIALNLKSPPAREAFLRLVETADVVVEGFRPGVMERLGCGWQTLEARNPRVILASVTGYGQQGPYRGLAGHDVNYLAMAGVLDLIGAPGGPPAIPGVQIADLAAGAMQAVMAILAALVERTRTGKGRHLDIGMTQGAAMLLPFALAQWKATGRVPERGKELLSGRYACYNVYRARDGRWLAVGALEPKFWSALCAGLELPDLEAGQFAEHPRQADVIGAVAARFAERDAADWFERLRGVDACVTPVLTVAEAAAALGLEAEAREPGPEAGAHTGEILEALGYGPAEIAAFET